MHEAGNGAAAAAVVVRIPCEPLNPWSGGIERASPIVLPECLVSSSSPRTRKKSSSPAHPILTQTVLLSSPKIVRPERAELQTKASEEGLNNNYTTGDAN